jgi:hypothetical protein
MDKVVLNKGLLSRLSGEMEGLEKDLEVLGRHKKEIVDEGPKMVREVYEAIMEGQGIDSQKLKDDKGFSPRTISLQLSVLWNELLIMRIPNMLDMRKNMNYTTDYCIEKLPERYICFIDKLKREIPERLIVR